MKVYYAICKLEPINQNQLGCYRMLECIEVDTEDRQAMDECYSRYMKRHTDEINIISMFFHIPTKDVKEILP